MAYDPAARLREPRLLTEPQAAAILGIAPRTLRAWREQGRAPQHINLGRFIRYSPSAVTAYIMKRQAETMQQEGKL